MKNKSFKKTVLMLIIGFACIALDFCVGTGLHYPHKYQNNKDTIGEFQYYNIASNYHASCDYKTITSTSQTEEINKAGQTFVPATAKVIDHVYYEDLQIDLFNDFLGLALIALACFRLKKCSRKFSFGGFCAICAFLVHLMIVAFPFFMNGIVLCYFAFFVGIGYLALLLTTLYFIGNGLFKMCPGVACRDERKWGRMVLFVILVLLILTTFIFWLGSDFNALHNLGILMEVFNGFLVFVFWKIMFRTGEYLEKSYEEGIAAYEL